MRSTNRKNKLEIMGRMYIPSLAAFVAVLAAFVAVLAALGSSLGLRSTWGKMKRLRGVTRASATSA